MKRKVALIFGGRSVEHDVSVITAMQVLANIDKKKYDDQPIYMKDGDFFAGCLDTLEAVRDFDALKHKKVVLFAGEFFSIKKSAVKKYFKPDVALIACHGGEGEDGTLQALLEYNGIPFTSPELLASSV